MGGDYGNMYDPWQQTPRWHWRRWVGYSMRRWSWDDFIGPHDGEWQYRTYEQHARILLEQEFG